MPKGFTQGFEVWVLSWLLAESLETADNRREAWRLKTSIWDERYPYVSLENLIRTMPNQLIKNVKSDKQILQKLVRMREKGLLENRDAWPDHTSRFFITPKGALKARKFWQLLIEMIEFIKSEWIPQTDGAETKKEIAESSKVKQFLSRISKKLKDRAEDELVDTTITEAKKHGATFFFKLIVHVLAQIGNGS